VSIGFGLGQAAGCHLGVCPRPNLLVRFAQLLASHFSQLGSGKLGVDGVLLRKGSLDVQLLPTSDETADIGRGIQAIALHLPHVAVLFRSRSRCGFAPGCAQAP
jgi:hypothetical protein